MDKKYRRINILIGELQYRKIQEASLNLSGLVRDMIEDRFSERKIVLSVNPETKALYDEVVSNYGVSDEDLEKYVLKALDSVLEEKAHEIDDMRSKIK